MNLDYKPDGYSTVSPYLVLTDAAGTLDFLKNVFDAEILRRIDGENERIMHAEVRIDDSVIMLADGTDGWPPIACHVHLYVRDVDATYARALSRGAKSVQEPVRKQDEDKRGGFTDIGGTTWWVATRQA